MTIYLLSFLLIQILVSSVITKQETFFANDGTVCRAPDGQRQVMSFTLSSQLILHVQVQLALSDNTGYVTGLDRWCSS